MLSCVQQIAVAALLRGLCFHRSRLISFVAEKQPTLVGLQSWFMQSLSLVIVII